MDTIEKTDDGFIVKTPKAQYHTKSVLLAVGRRGTPRKLGVPGEEQTKVVYNFIDAAQYRNKNVLVVGGGNSALEAAASIAKEPGTKVTLSYRSNAFSKANPKNVESVKNSSDAGELTLALKSTVKEIDDKQVTLNTTDGELKIDNDAVIVCAGGVLPTPMLRSLGVEIETKHGTL
jgi:thioredoxin reductase